MPLTDKQVKSATNESTTTKKLSDGQGLQLWVMASGSKLWRLAYRHGGKQKLLALGRYPELSVADARRKRDDHRKILETGVDPSLVRKLSSANTFNVVADEWLERQRAENRAEATIGKNRWVLSFARPGLGERPVSEITPIEVLAVLRLFEAKGHLETGRRARAIMGSVFRFAIATARAENDPTIALRGAIRPPKVTHRAAITDASEFGALIRAIDGFSGQPTTRLAMQLCALLAPRPGELRLAQWSEFDLEAGLWIVPAGRMKMRKPHEVPLSRQSIALLKELHAFTGRGSLLFPSIRTNAKPISENTLNAALRRMGYGSDDMTAHGFRASFSTLANESGEWNVDAIERHLAHEEGNEVRRAYNRGAYWIERVQLSQWWADKIDCLRSDGKVVIMRPRIVEAA